MVEQPVVELVRRYLSALTAQGLPVRFGIVFGSQATGRAGQWSDGAPKAWKLHAGANTLEVRAVNKFGLPGAISKVVLEMK